jgi:hypothetical protein
MALENFVLNESSLKRSIVQLDFNNIVIGRFNSGVEAFRTLSVSKSFVYRALKS